MDFERWSGAAIALVSCNRKENQDLGAIQSKDMKFLLGNIIRCFAESKLTAHSRDAVANIGPSFIPIFFLFSLLISNY